MKRARWSHVAWAGTIFGLCVACAGKTHNLGDPFDVGGSTASNRAGGPAQISVTGGGAALSGGSWGAGHANGGAGPVLEMGGNSSIDPFDEVGGATSEIGGASSDMGGASSGGASFGDENGGMPPSNTGSRPTNNGGTTDLGGAPAAGGFQGASGGAPEFGGTGGSTVSTSGMMGFGGAPVAAGGLPASGSSPTASGGATTASGGTSYGKGGAPATTATTYYEYPPRLAGAIDATCQCKSVDEVCDSFNVCTARCDEGRRCVKWQTNHAVRSMFHDGTALYFATARSTDVLGNPSTLDGSLYTFDPVSGSSTQIATGLEDPVQILGRYQHSTFLSVFDGSNLYSLVEIADTGEATKIAVSKWPAMNLQGKWLVFMDGTGQPRVDSTGLNILDWGVLAINLELGRTPFKVSTIDLDSVVTLSLVIVGDSAIYRGEYGYNSPKNAGTMSLTNPAASPSSLTPAFLDYLHGILASDTSRVYLGGSQKIGGYVRAYDAAGTPQLIVYNDSNTTNLEKALPANGWMYSSVQTMYSNPLLVRYPTTVGRLPQVVLPEGFGTTIFAVGKSDIFWTYPLDKANSGQYIFQTALPAQPCDSLLPCADSTLVCAAGSCAKGL